MLQSRNMPSQTSPKSQPAEIGGQDRLSGVELAFDRYAFLIAPSVVAIGFAWRMWLAQATFLNTDEAWHFTLANQASAHLAYKASLTISHPPLLILVVHYWRLLGTSALMLRLPSVIAGAAFCWVFCQWLTLVAGRAAALAGLIFAAFLGPMISTAAEVRQNPLLLVFAASAIYLFDRALEEDSVVAMSGSAACLYFAMLSHYSAFFVAGALGVYSILRLTAQKPSTSVTLTWFAGQTIGVALAGFLYRTHLGRLNTLLDQALLPQQYLSRSYFHSNEEHLLPFLYRGTFGVFRFVFGQTQIGQLAALLFVAGIILLILRNTALGARHRSRALGILLLLPFVLNWVAAGAGLYPYGRMRQCMFLAIFCLAGVSICLGMIARQRSALTGALALGIVVLCHAFGTLQDRDAFPVSEQRHEHMDAAIQFVQTHIRTDDLILTDEATSYQLRYYLCGREAAVDSRPDADGVFRCGGLQVLSSGTAAGALSPDGLDVMYRAYGRKLDRANRIWVVQGGWASGLGEALRTLPAFSNLEIHSFGRYLEVFQIPPPSLPPVLTQPAR